jgi:drug/metabolite transporter (DMT)-like permease
MGSVVVVMLAVLLVVAAALLLRSRQPNPWPLVITAMITSGLCFMIGGDSTSDSREPTVATVTAAVVGVLAVASAIVAMIPRPRERTPSRVPVLMATAAIVVGGIGLLVNELAR